MHQITKCIKCWTFIIFCKDNLFAGMFKRLKFRLSIYSITIFIGIFSSFGNQMISLNLNKETTFIIIKLFLIVDSDLKYPTYQLDNTQILINV